MIIIIPWLAVAVAVGVEAVDEGGRIEPGGTSEKRGANPGPDPDPDRDSVSSPAAAVAVMCWGCCGGILAVPALLSVFTEVLFAAAAVAITAVVAVAITTPVRLSITGKCLRKC